LHPAESRVRKLAAAHPARYFVFDLLVDAKGRDHTASPLAERRAALENFMRAVADNSVALSPASRDVDTARAWLAERGTGRDGVMAKLLDQPYRSGERDAMVKVKKLRSADCVVGGF